MVESKRWASWGHQAAFPVTHALPEDTGRKPSSTESNVDFPEPEGPVTASHCPGAASALSPLNTGVPPGHDASRPSSNSPAAPSGRSGSFSTPPPASEASKAPDCAIRRSTAAKAGPCRTADTTAP